MLHIYQYKKSKHQNCLFPSKYNATHNKHNNHPTKLKQEINNKQTGLIKSNPGTRRSHCALFLIQNQMIYQQLLMEVL